MNTLIAFVVLALLVRYIFRRYRARSKSAPLASGGSSSVNVQESFSGSREACLNFCAELYNAYPPELYATRTVVPPRRFLPFGPFRVTVDRLSAPRVVASVPPKRRSPRPPLHAT